MSIFECIEKQLKEEKPFVVYSKAHQNSVVGLFQKTGDLHFLEGYDSKGFVFAPFEGEKAVFIPTSLSEVVVEPWEAVPVSNTDVELDYSDVAAKTQFEKLVHKGVAAIRDQQFEKVVFSRKERIDIPSYNVVSLYKKLKSTYPTAFCYLFYHPKVGMWMGATPEQLLKVSDGRVYTMALAGTQVNQQQETVIWGEKEKQEQLFVTDFIIDSLKEYLEDISKTEPFTAYAGKIMHIRTDIEGKLKSAKDLNNIIQKLHPTPAVCGMPKVAARDFILREEGYDRKFYSGYLGELNVDIVADKDGQTDLFVNLRCMELEENKIHLYIGCGITKDSIAADEFVETVNKSGTMKKILQ